MTRLLQVALAGIGLVVAGVMAAGPVQAGGTGRNRVFTVGNYPVEARDKNAVAAKEKAHADGQQAALQSLFKRIVPVTSYAKLERLRNLKASDILDGVAVRSERNSATQYIASLDFTFQADPIRETLKREGIPFVDEQAAQTVLIPIVMLDGKYAPATGEWSKVWSGLDLDNALAPLKVEALKPAIGQDLIKAAVPAGEGMDRVFVSEYKAPQVVLAIAETDAAQKKLNVTIAGQDSAGPFSWTRAYRIEDGDVGYAMELASVITLGVLEGRWKAVKEGGVPADVGAGSFGVPAGAATGTGADVDILVEFSNPEEWNDLRGRILDTPGVDDVRVNDVSPQSAGVTVSFPGGAGVLTQTLQAQGLSVTNSGGRLVLRGSY